MLEVLIRAGSFAAIILLGYLLKKIGLFKDSDFPILSNLVLKITLPGAIIANFANKTLDPSLLILTLLGLMFGCVYAFLGYLMNLHGTREKQAFAVLNLPGYNIGCFAMPFIQSFLGPTGVIATCLFDIGNGVVCLGGSFSIASMIKNGGKFSVARIVRTLLKSIPFVLYVVMPILCLAKVPVPDAVTSFAGIIGNANAFLAMFMIGVGFNLNANKDQTAEILRIVIVRYTVAALIALAVYFLLPMSLEIRKTLVLLVFSPVGAAVPAFTGELKSDVGLSSAINSICIVCSIIFMVILLPIV